MDDQDEDMSWVEWIVAWMFYFLAQPFWMLFSFLSYVECWFDDENDKDDRDGFA